MSGAKAKVVFFHFTIHRSSQSIYVNINMHLCSQSNYNVLSITPLIHLSSLHNYYNISVLRQMITCNVLQ